MADELRWLPGAFRRETCSAGWGVFFAVLPGQVERGLTRKNYQNYQNYREPLFFASPRS